jgi:XTP/dITP diphosphohydrolase
MGTVLVATRSEHKLREIGEILAGHPGLSLVGLDGVGIPEDPVEDAIEAFDSFQQNALAKARHFSRLSGLPTLADDSGLCVDALGGAPGVRSKRFSGRADLRGVELDRANNERLLRDLRAVPAGRRSAHYLCALALVTPDGAEEVFLGRCDGSVLTAPRGDGGFGYDPLFYVPAEDATFAEIPSERKNERSHRTRALRAAAGALERLSGGSAG